MDEEKLAVWSTATVNNFPDSSFAFVESGGSKDGEGKTTPRNLRHLPYKDGSGKVDLPHLRNALARAGQIKLKDGSKISESKVSSIQNRLRKILEKETGKESQSKITEDSKMTEEVKTEKLDATNTPSSPDEGAKVAEAKTDAQPAKEAKPTVKEQLEEAPVEEAPKEEEAPAEEAPAEEAPAEEENKEGEALSKEIDKTKEELSVVKEVRDELVALYARNQDITTEREKLSKDVESLTKELKETKESLSRYQVAETKLLAKERAERIEKLSEKFKILGQEKSIEQLEKKDEETLSEFEKIVDAALDKAGETKAMPVVTKPSQAAKMESPRAAEALNKEAPVKAPEKLLKSRNESNDEFFARMCNTLTGEQNKSGKTVRLL